MTELATETRLPDPHSRVSVIKASYTLFKIILNLNFFFALTFPWHTPCLIIQCRHRWERHSAFLPHHSGDTLKKGL